MPPVIGAAIREAVIANRIRVARHQPDGHRRADHREIRAACVSGEKHGRRDNLANAGLGRRKESECARGHRLAAQILAGRSDIVFDR